jgi:hypothetical protein
MGGSGGRHPFKQHSAAEPQPKSNFSDPIFLPQNASSHPGPESERWGQKIFFDEVHDEGLRELNLR